MITIYTSPGCASCRKAKQWLKEKNLKYVEKNIFSTILNEEEIKNLFVRCENGTDDIISKRSKIIRENGINIDEMSLHDLIGFIQKNPSILRRPIIINERSILVGYDSEEIDVFVPEHLRRISLSSCNSVCPNYEVCGRLRDDTEDFDTVNIVNR